LITEFHVSEPQLQVSFHVMSQVRTNELQSALFATRCSSCQQ